jgi:hypothetical protein
MTRKDFELIANVLNRAYRQVDPRLKGLMDDVVADFVVALGRTNSRFSAEKFWEACRDQTR